MDQEGTQYEEALNGNVILVLGIVGTWLLIAGLIVLTIAVIALASYAG